MNNHCWQLSRQFPFPLFLLVREKKEERIKI